MRRAVFVIAFTAFSLAFGVPLYATGIGATGGWTGLTIGSSDLTGGAGTDLQNSYESTSNATMINITGTVGSDDAWQVQVRKSDTWPSEVSLQLKRTGDGSGGGTVSGGNSYIVVGTSDADFFNGTGDRTAIPVQYKISGMSISVPPDNYSTSVTFTVVDI